MDKNVSDRIQKRAYEFFVQRGGTHGHAMEDWLTAEREIEESRSTPVAAPRKKKSGVVRKTRE